MVESMPDAGLPIRGVSGQKLAEFLKKLADL